MLEDATRSFVGGAQSAGSVGSKVEGARSRVAAHSRLARGEDNFSVDGVSSERHMHRAAPWNVNPQLLRWRGGVAMVGF